MADWLHLLDRIDAQRRSVDAQTLAHLQSQALLRLPFENLDIHLGRPIHVDVSALYDKIVVARRGGFCYELNEAFLQCLLALGFEADRLQGRVTLGGGEGHAFDHQCSLVRVDGHRWLTDVGFGDNSMVPLDVDTTQPQDGGVGRFRVEQRDSCFELYRETEADTWSRQLVVDPQPQPWEAFGDRCAWTQTAAESVFTGKRLCSQATADGRISLAGNRLKVTKDGSVTERPVAEADYLTVLADHFGVHLSQPAWTRPLEASV